MIRKARKSYKVSVLFVFFPPIRKEELKSYSAAVNIPSVKETSFKDNRKR